jgi:hypothetical protein
MVIGVVFGVNLWVIRGLNFPLWGDSYQHTVIAQLIVDNGGLFDSWLPYVPLKTFTYHYGFHTTVALFHWLTGIEMPRAVLIVGQLLNGLAALTVYPLAVRLTKNRWAGLMAVLIAGLVSPMPGFYVNWGRYTQLAGQVILPVALWFTSEMVEHPRLNWQRLSLAIIAMAGLALTHYQVLLIYVVILPAWWFVYCVYDKVARPYWLRSLGRLALLGALSLLAISPWFANTVSSRLARSQIHLALVGHRNQFIRNEYNRIGSVRTFVPTGLLGLTGFGFLLGFFRKRPLSLFIWLWIVSLFLLSNPYLLRLPGTGVVNNFTVLISLYIPVAIMAGYGVVSVIDHAQRHWRWAPVVAGVLVTAVSLRGAYSRTQVLDPSSIMVTPSDERAMAWIRVNTPPDAEFLVNGFFAFGGSSVVGADAGWWIPFLTGRQNTVPPLNYDVETPYWPGYAEQVEGFIGQVQETNLATAEGLNLLKQNQITHIYLGQAGGRVGNPGEPLLSIENLVNAPYYELVYHEDQVWIFEVHAKPLNQGQ